MINNIDEERAWILARNEEYRKGRPTVPDAVFDARYNAFCEMYPDDIIANKAVLEEVFEEGVKEPLPIKMFSLNKKKYIPEIRAWATSKGLPEDAELIAMGKYDGISMVNDELITKAHTRGDGTIGTNKTAHLKLIRSTNFFNTLSDEDKDFYSIGEAIMPRKDWMENFDGKINKKSNKLYKSARNTVAGMFNNETPNPEDLKHVVFMRYGLVMKSGEQLSKIEQLDRVNCLNVIEVPYEVVRLNDPDLETTLNNLYEKWSVDFYIDGIVLEINDPIIREDLGREKNNNPAWSIAYKNPDWAEVANTPVIGLNIRISKLGALTPVMAVEPVVLGGAEIKNPTAYNMKYVLDNNIAIGSEINLIRSGDVIPKHLETTSFIQEEVDKLWKTLEHCPCCKAPTAWDANGTQLLCTNDYCPERLLSKLIYFFESIDTKEFGEGELEKLFKKGYQTPESIINLTYDELIRMDGWGDKSIQTLFKQLDELKTVGIPLANLIQALDLFDGKIGSKTAQKILDEYVGSENYDDFDAVERMCKIVGVAEISANAFIKGYKAYYNRFSNFPAAIKYIKTPQEELLGDKYVGFSVCMTGFRDEVLENKIKAYGGTIASGVSKNTTHLLVKDMDSGSKKIESARKLKAKGVNIEIMTREEFIDL